MNAKMRNTVSGSNTLLKSSVAPSGKTQMTAPLETIHENQKFSTSMQQFPRGMDDQKVEGEVIINEEVFFKTVMSRDYGKITDL